jgi:hypothetical protein
MSSQTAPAIERLPSPDDVRADLHRNLEERRVLRTLLKIVLKRQQQVGGREAKRA